jgi:hypothetical protein
MVASRVPCHARHRPMPPKPRDTSAGVFHVYTHCVWAAADLYRDDVDKLEFLRGLADVTRRHGWKCVAYCLMRTHYHLIVRVQNGVLPRAMHRLNLGYARHHNGRHGLRVMCSAHVTEPGGYTTNRSSRSPSPTLRTTR